MNGDTRLAVDIGGTFTDVVLEHDGTRRSTKVLTTTDAPETGVLEGIDAMLAQSGVSPGEVRLVIHGTTLATNALIERKGARTALVTTDGFRDSVEIAYEHRFEQYDIYMERPQPLVPRVRRHVVPERIAADGSVLLSLDEAALAALVPLLVEQRVEALAVCFLHSYVNSDHERRAYEILSAALPDVAITLSSEVCPEIREYDRMSTTSANAYVQPMIASYLRGLRSGLQDKGVACPLLLMMSSGGITTAETAMAFPIRLVESGPAGGAILAQNIAAENGIDKVLSFDMGGTTAKITIIDDQQPQLSRAFEVARMYRFLKGSGLPLRIPVIDMVEIGAGGGSIAMVDELRRITVGPESAGSNPGPACYGRGGDDPTVTDADVVIGKIDPARFAGGKVPIEPARAAAALDRVVGGPLDMTTEIAAAGVSEIVTENMANAARVHAIENGKDTADRTLIAFGGAAPLHATRLAGKLSISQIIIPQGAGVGSAVGFLRAPIAYEVVRTRFMALPRFDAGLLNDLFADMRAEAEAVVRLGAGEREVESLTETRTAFMRYRGQGHEIAVALPVRAYGDDDREKFDAAFDAEYRELYSRTIPNLEVEILTWTLSLGTARPLPAVCAPARETYSPDPVSRRPIFDPDRGEEIMTAIYPRDDLHPGATIAGPSVIVEDETSTLVTDGFTATINTLGQIVLTKQEQAQ
ncbi:MAG: hydantoinase/oxoprolinase family protein [Alphaproteobacteria bacterium]|nr:hydantoinase/oxoprolinase family protein [Alphaproteobacteria bacterium]